MPEIYLNYFIPAGGCVFRRIVFIQSSQAEVNAIALIIAAQAYEQH